jgi:tetratricopeptide (TPR) repeat protein
MERAKGAADEALEAVGETEDDESRMSALVCASRVDFHSTDPAVRARATRMTERALELARRLGNARTETVLTANLGEMLRFEGDLGRATELYVEALRLVRGEARHSILFDLGQAAVEQNDPDGAEKRYREAHAVSGTGEERLWWAYDILSMGQVAALRSQHERATRLLGAAAAALEKFGEKINPMDQRVLDPLLAACREALDDAAFETAWSAGRALPIEQSLADAFDGTAT